MLRTLVVFAFVVAATAFGAATASAEVYPNCKTAAEDGRYDIPSDDPAYGPHLDRDQDGIGCES
ncbi:MAG TPA: excalibur calcium-binding domain-containing protein [Mycobacterium sp.]|nr:excalibur calcium-binding domain-containing protein [Mycobacterium sp.]